MAKDLESSTRAITAAEARKTAETTNVYLNRIYKAIKEEAKEGRIVVYWYRKDVAVRLLESTVKTLKENGFNVGYVDDSIKISW